jgi:CheY-like chemotaxis protein
MESPTVRLRILYCDDEQEFRDRFISEHEEEFDIEALESITAVASRLRDSSKPFPDLLLLDLYHPDPGEEFAARRDEIQRTLRELNVKIAELKDVVERAMSPVGIDLLEDIRSRHAEHELPVMVYTKRGFLLLEDAELRKIVLADADWLLKDPHRVHPETLRASIWRYVRQSRAVRASPPTPHVEPTGSGPIVFLGPVFRPEIVAGDHVEYTVFADILNRAAETIEMREDVDEETKEGARGLVRRMLTGAAGSLGDAVTDRVGALAAGAIASALGIPPS